MAKGVQKELRAETGGATPRGQLGSSVREGGQRSGNQGKNSGSNGGQLLSLREQKTRKRE